MPATCRKSIGHRKDWSTNTLHYWWVNGRCICPSSFLPSFRLKKLVFSHKTFSVFDKAWRKCVFIKKKIWKQRKKDTTSPTTRVHSCISIFKNMHKWPFIGQKNIRYNEPCVINLLTFYFFFSASQSNPVSSISLSPIALSLNGPTATSPKLISHATELSVLLISFFPYHLPVF